MARFALLCLLCATVNEVTWRAHGESMCLNKGKSTQERAFHSDPEMGILPWHSTNISCVTYLFQHVTCTWNPSENSDNTEYLVTVTRRNKKLTDIKSDKTKDISCSFRIPGLSDNVTVVVTSSTDKRWQIHFDDMFATVKYNPPELLMPEIYSGGIQVKWTFEFPNASCEVQDLQEASAIKRLWNCDYCDDTLDITDVRPCSNHTLTVRCHDAQRMSPWSEWSPAVKTFFPINGPVSLRLWRRVLKPDEEGGREVHLMWKGPPQSCGLEYQLFVDSSLNRTLDPSLNQTSVYLTTGAHEVTIAAHKDKTIIPENASVVIPDHADGGPPVQSAQATTIDGQVLVSWDAPLCAVTSYMVVWHTHQGIYMWQETSERNLSFSGLNHTLYTITITPLCGGVPGNDITLHAYAVEGEPATVSAVAVTDVDDRWARVEWDAVRPDQCCGFVLSYTVTVYTADATQQPKLNVTVIHRNGKPDERYFVILKDLQPSTEYSVYVTASSAGGSSTSNPSAFKTRPFGRRFIMNLVLTAVAALVLLIIILSMLICLKPLFHKLPNPRLSSVGKWTHVDPKKLSSPWGVCQPSDQGVVCNISTLEDILPCHSDSGESQRFISEARLEWTDNYESVPSACTISPQTGSLAPPADAPDDGAKVSQGRPQDLVLADHPDEPHLEHVQSYISVDTGQKLAHSPVTLGSSVENRGTEQEPGEKSTLINELSYIAVSESRPNKVES